MGFFWKFSRNGWKSRTYQSYIIDVLPSSFTRINGKKIWKTSFEELEVFLILLQDIEVRNNPKLGATKPDFDKFVRQLGYKATTNYEISGIKHILGEAVIGRHNGSPLPWGYYSNKATPITVDVTNLKYDYVVSFNSAKGKDMLQHYVDHAKFESNGDYWDYMPMHSCLLDIVDAIKKCDNKRAEKFLLDVLKWERL